MKTAGFGRYVLAFVVAVAFATAWGSVVQTQYNLAALASIGADIEAVRWQTTLRDLFSGFFPTYGGYVVVPALLIAFAIAAAIARRQPRARLPLYVLAGFLAILAGIPLVNQIAPLALVFGATRDWSCTLWMAAGGGGAGALFALSTRYRRQPALR